MVCISKPLKKLNIASINSYISFSACLHLFLLGFFLGNKGKFYKILEIEIVCSTNTTHGGLQRRCSHNCKSTQKDRNKGRQSKQSIIKVSMDKNKEYINKVSGVNKRVKLKCWIQAWHLNHLDSFNEKGRGWIVNNERSPSNPSFFG